MRVNRMSFKIISYILIQAFICLDLFAAGAVANPVDMTTLAPAMTINKADLQIAFDEINAKNNADEEFDLDFEDVDMSEEANEDTSTGIEADETEDMSAFESPDPENSGSQSASANTTNTSNTGASGELPDGLIPPPLKQIQDSSFSYSGRLVTTYQGEEEVEEISIQELIDKHGMEVADVGFVQKLIEPLVKEHSTMFEDVIWTKPQDLPKDELRRAEQGPFSVKANTRSQNAVDLAASAVILGWPVDQIMGTMLVLLGLSKEGVGDKSEQVITALYSVVTTIQQKGGIKLADVYALATQLVNDLRNLGFDFADIEPIKRRTLGVRAHHMSTLRKKYAQNQQNVVNYIKNMVILHEESHILPMNVLAHQLKWSAFRTKETALEIFRTLIAGDWPKQLMQWKFSPILEEDEYRTQVDVIKQSQWLYGYNPLKKEFKGAYWKEAIANYYVFLKLLDREHGNDGLAVETMALGMYYAMELNPPNPDTLELGLYASVGSFMPFLDNEQATRVINRVLELQVEEGLFKEQALKIQESLKQQGMFSTSFSSNTVYNVAAPTIALSAMEQATDVVQMSSFGDVQSWLVAAAVIVGVSVGAWIWKKLPWGKSTERRTEQLVNKAAREHARDAQNVNLIDLHKFYANSSLREQRVIIETIRTQILSNPNKVEPIIFEPFFQNILEFGPKNVFQNLQSSVSEKMKVQSSDSLKIPVVLMTSTVEDALKTYNKRSLPQDRVNIKAVSLRLAELTVNLAARNMLHDRSVFVQSLLNNAAWADYVNADQADKLYTAIVDELPNAFASRNEIASEIVEKELEKLKARINATQVASDITPHLAVSLSSLENSAKADGFLQAILASSKSLQQSSLDNSQLDNFFATINEKLINGVAMRVAFSDSYAIIKSEVKKLGLGVDTQETALALFPVITRASFFDREELNYEELQDEAAYRIFYYSLENEISGLKFSSVSSLEDFSALGMGTERLVGYLMDYLRTEGTNINMSLEKKISVVINNLSESDIRGEAADKAELAVDPVEMQDVMPLQTVARTFAKKEFPQAEVDEALISAPELLIGKQSFQRRFVNLEIVDSAI